MHPRSVRLGIAYGYLLCVSERGTGLPVGDDNSFVGSEVLVGLQCLMTVTPGQPARPRGALSRSPLLFARWVLRPEVLSRCEC